MSVIGLNKFKPFIKEFPEMYTFYPQLNNAADREFMYDNFFAEEAEYDYEPDTDDYEYQQSLYA
jgi:hypothetical protein